MSIGANAAFGSAKAAVKYGLTAASATGLLYSANATLTPAIPPSKKPTMVAYRLLQIWIQIDPVENQSTRTAQTSSGVLR
jgi:hypothetical protein